MAGSNFIPITQDLRWKWLVKTYAPNPERFQREVLLTDLSDQQIELHASVAAPSSRTSVASGHGTGKTRSIAGLCLWHLCCFRFSNTLLTANDMDQMKVTIWKEIDQAVLRMRQTKFAWLADYIEVLADGSARIRGFEKSWFIESKTANRQNANKMAGRHADWLLIIVDEASTVADEVTTTLNGALSSGAGNRMLMTSQPTHTSGFFYRTQTELSVRHGGNWNDLVFSSVDSPWVSDEALLEWWQTYDDDEKRVRVLGEFPQDASNKMMGMKHAESMYSRGQIIGDDEAYGWFVLCDVALGEGERDKSAIVIARVIGEGDYGPHARRVEITAVPLHTNRVRSTQLPGNIQEAGATYENPTYIVDAGGLGGTTCQALEENGIPVTRVLWGQPCKKSKNKKRYRNKRAQAMHQAARAAKEGRLSILTNRYTKTLKEQAANIPKRFVEGGKIKVPEKGSTDWEGRGSPDLWDAICFAFLEGVSYMPVSGNRTKSSTDEAESVSEAMDKAADDAFGDIAAQLENPAKPPAAIVETVSNMSWWTSHDHNPRNTHAPIYGDAAGAVVGFRHCPLPEQSGCRPAPDDAIAA